MEIEVKQKSEGQISLLKNEMHAVGNSVPALFRIIEPEKQMPGLEDKPALLRDILHAIFMVDHDAAQFEQYLLENDIKV